ncbi:MAG: molybdopterin molybdotransferase MoeA, partial [Bifidobacteriaceae bacterium]|nr:molybdopterin molybdotransferase MoeA [Bifidobacteriaceae bacterium]
MKGAAMLTPHRVRLDVEAYLDAVQRLMAPLPPVTVGLAEALGRELAEPVHSRLPLPPFDNSAMDGYALAGPGETYRLMADVAAGDHRSLSLRAGQAARVMTGARLPTGTTAVLPVEQARVEAGQVSATAPVRPGQHIRLRGEDAAQGQLVLAAGAALGPVQLAAAAACGAGRVSVRSRPRVAVVVTGSELTDPDGAPGPGGIFDSNSTLLRTACLKAGAVMASHERLPDQPGRTAKVLERAGAASDLVLVSGGVSAGAYDYVRDSIAALGGTVAAVAMRP